MTRAYAVHGLRLTSPVELPGLAPSDDAPAPTVSLSLGSRDELERDWSGGSTLWEGESHGGALVYARDEQGAHRLAHAVHGIFQIAPGAGRIACAPTDPDGSGWKRILLRPVVASAAVLHGAEMLHAAAVDTDFGAIALVAPSGGGKTTLAAALLAHGGTLLTDDLLALASTREGVRAESGPAVASVSAGDLDGWPDALVEAPDPGSGKAWVVATPAAPHARRLAALCFVHRAPGLELRLVTQPRSPLDVLPHLMDLALGDVRARTRFELVSDLAEQVPFHRLEAPPDASPDALAELLLTTIRARAAAGSMPGRAGSEDGETQ